MNRVWTLKQKCKCDYSIQYYSNNLNMQKEKICFQYVPPPQIVHFSQRSPTLHAQICPFRVKRRWQNCEWGFGEPLGHFSLPARLRSLYLLCSWCVASKKVWYSSGNHHEACVNTHRPVIHVEFWDAVSWGWNRNTIISGAVEKKKRGSLWFLFSAHVIPPPRPLQLDTHKHVFVLWEIHKSFNLSCFQTNKKKHTVVFFFLFFFLQCGTRVGALWGRGRPLVCKCVS